MKKINIIPQNSEPQPESEKQSQRYGASDEWQVTTPTSLVIRHSSRFLTTYKKEN